MLKIPLTKTWVKIIDTFDWQVSIHLGNWSHVLNYVNKAENTSELAEVRTIHKFSTKSILLLLSGHVFKEIILLHESYSTCIDHFFTAERSTPKLGDPYKAKVCSRYSNFMKNFVRWEYICLYFGIQRDNYIYIHLHVNCTKCWNTL